MLLNRGGMSAMLEHLHAATFGAQLHTQFSILLASPPVVDVELVEVTERGSADSRQPAAAVRQERFSIVFRGPRERPLGQGTYQMQHDHLGAFELFLVPIGQDHTGVYYEAVFNRLRQQDG
jgi:hypothetical protein